MSKGKRPGGGGGGSNTVPQVTGLTATQTTNGVDLMWNPVPNATTYWVYRSDQGKNAIAIIPPTTFTDRYPVAGTSYQIAAVVNSVLGPKSSSVTVNT